MTDEFDLEASLSKYAKKPSEVTTPELVVLYGRAGSGKTYAAASASELTHVKKVLILDSEGSTAGTLTDFADDVVTIIPVTSIEMFEGITEKLFDPTVKNPYDVVIVDTLDVLQDWKERALSKANPGDKWAAYRELGPWTMDLGRNLKALGALSIIVLHEKEDKSSEGSVVKNLRLVGSSRENFPGVPDVVAYLERRLFDNEGVEEEHTVAYFATKDNFVTKNRFKFPPVMLDPSFTKMYDHIAANRKENN